MSRTCMNTEGKDERGRLLHTAIRNSQPLLDTFTTNFNLNTNENESHNHTHFLKTDN